MKKGVLFTNHFLSSSHFDALYSLIAQAAEERGVALQRVTGGDCVCAFDRHPAKDADFVLFWDKDIAAARRIERHGIPVFNCAEAIRVCDNKAETADALARAGLPIPRTLTAPMTYETVGYPDTDFVKRAAAELGLPMIIKECYGSFGEQVYLVATVEEAQAAVRRIGARPFLFQAFVDTSFGTDVRVNVVGDRAVCAMRRTGQKGDFRSNIAHGGAGEAYALSEKEERIAVAAAQAVKADFAGVDLLFGKDGPLVCEVNSNPHFTGTYKHTGINLATRVFDHILSKI